MNTKIYEFDPVIYPTRLWVCKQPGESRAYAEMEACEGFVEKKQKLNENV